MTAKKKSLIDYKAIAHAVQGIVQMQHGDAAVLAIRNVLTERGMGLCLPNVGGRFVEYETVMSVSEEERKTLEALRNGSAKVVLTGDET